MSIFPEGYKVPESSSSRFLKFEDGKEVKIRVLSEAVTGLTVYMPDKKSVRWNVGDKAPERPYGAGFQGKGEAKPNHYIAFVIWNYSTEQTEIFETTRSALIQKIYDLDNDTDWGDLREYDVKIKGDKGAMKWEFALTPSSKKEVDPLILKYNKENPIDLKAWANNENAFDASLNGETISIEDIPFAE